MKLSHMQLTNISEDLRIVMIIVVSIFSLIADDDAAACSLL